MRKPDATTLKAPTCVSNHHEPGGWNPATGTIPSSVLEEIDQAFSNIDLALRTAGGTGWSQVYRVRLYALDTEMTEENLSRMVENIDKWCGGKGGKGKENRPVLTGVGVSKLGQPGMRFEIEVAAYLG